MNDALGGGSGADFLRRIATQVMRKVDPALMAVGADKVEEFMEHVGSSSPRPRAEATGAVRRWQDEVIQEEIPSGASVLDLGCGAGQLLASLIDAKGVRGQGIELDPDAVADCVGRGVPVIQSDLDEGLREFPTASFDYVVLEETLQTLRQPARILEEMLRVGQRGMVSFPNFGFWRVRLDVAVRGRMPVTEFLPHHWYDTPNIHLFSLQDFVDWTRQSDVHITRGYVLEEGIVRELRPEDNLYAEEALLVIERGR